ncbi:hypothetical protein RRSWK_03081 [Rhodopirellula sp. SWK7]|nr:hypothetical protein RRSWK_03081 [Rhodopirellula sp. SWK7]
MRDGRLRGKKETRSWRNVHERDRSVAFRSVSGIINARAVISKPIREDLAIWQPAGPDDRGRLWRRGFRGTTLKRRDSNAESRSNARSHAIAGDCRSRENRSSRAVSLQRGDVWGDIGGNRSMGLHRGPVGESISNEDLLVHCPRIRRDLRFPKSGDILAENAHLPD